jgi:hypothetical protein
VPAVAAVAMAASPILKLVRLESVVMTILLIICFAMCLFICFAMCLFIVA